MTRPNVRFENIGALILAKRQKIEQYEHMLPLCRCERDSWALVSLGCFVFLLGACVGVFIYQQIIGG